MSRLASLSLSAGNYEAPDRVVDPPLWRLYGYVVGPLSKMWRRGGCGSWLWRYSIAVAALASGTAVRLVLDPTLEHRAPYGIYLIAVLFVVWRAGFGPGLVTVAGGMLLGRYLFDVPRGSAALVAESNQASLIMSLTIGIVTAIVCESLRITARDNRRLYEAVRQEDVRKDQFLANLAHELRNPLMPIRNAVHLLGRIETGDSRAAELHELIGRHTEHLIRLVNDLLEVSRITQAKIELHRERVALQSVVDGALDVVRPLVAEKRQQLEVALPTGPTWLFADGVRLTQILTNLLHNAAKYTPEGGRIWLNVETERDQFVIRVRDTGIGIDPQMQQRIFNLFEQVPEAMEHSRGGLGIGLTLVRTLVELHGGTVEAASPGLGDGAEFVVRLPGTYYRDVRPEKMERSGQEAPGYTPLRILVVDDSPSVAKTLEMILRDWRHVVETKSDAFAALETARTFKPDLILADLGMPGMNGYQFAKRLREVPEMQHVVLIAVSGYGQQSDVQKSKAVGFARHLIKPVDLAELKQVLATYRAHCD